MNGWISLDDSFVIFNSPCIAQARPTCYNRTMHSFRKTFGALLLLMLLTIPAWAPLTRPGLPAWRAGALPALALGSGSPGIALLPARVLHLAGLPNAAALKTSLALGVILIAYALFFGIRRLWGDKMGVLTAVLVIYSPIFLSALYIEGITASVWLMLGGASLAWTYGRLSWQRMVMGGAGLLLVVATLFRASPQPSFAFYRLFETPWAWGTQSIDLQTPFAWTPGLIILALTLIVLWRLATHGHDASRQDARMVWNFFFTGLLFLGLSFFAGEMRTAFLLISAIPLAVMAASLLLFLPDLKTPAIWAALLLLPILAVGPGLSPDFVQYPIPEQPAALFGQNQIMLIDARLDGELAPGQTVTVHAVWQALKPIDFDYNLFIHIDDDAGATVAQFDGQPQNGQRPMTSWLPGEIISDAYQIDIPADAPASLHVQLGLYNWQTLARLPLAAGGDALMIKDQ